MTTRVDAPLDRRVWRIAFVIVFGAFASGLDASLTNIGLSTIGTDLRAGLAQVQWVANGYLVAMAVSLPLCGWLTRRIGAGRLWLYALACFTVASGLCATATGLMWLVALRIVQGLAAGLLVPAGQTVLGQAVGKDRLGRMMSTLGIVVSLAPALGPVVGGVLLHSLAWPWLFLINLPIGVVGLLLGLRVIPRGQPGASTRLDWLGFAWIGLGLPLVLYGLTVPATIALIVGALALLAFGLRTARRPNPLLDLTVYRNRGYLLATLATGCGGALMFGSALIFPLYFENLHHDPALTAGIRLLATGLGTGTIVPIAGRLTDRHGGGLIATIGAACALATTIPFALLGADANPVLIEVLLALFGMAIGLTILPPSIVAFKAVRTDQLPDATTQISIVQRVGGAIGGAVFTVVLSEHLAADRLHAFQLTFWLLAGTAALTLVLSGLLYRAGRCHTDRVLDDKLNRP
ncbi:MAG TPA: DHA2 family efflux MFS transporter permease subunit [Pseudonocardiaceae bacterium]|nr:DHA2 family efflux MFS transporter permease subunit [Pseudonocardiaceae bacterium]